MLDDQPFDKRKNNAATHPAYLSVWNVEAYYGESYIVQDVSFNVHEGEILALLGRNGAGKTSTLRSIARVDEPEIRRGEIWFDNNPLHKMRAHQAAALGVATIPQAAVASYPDLIRNHFGIADDRLILCAISFGYADPDAPANQFRTERAEITDIIDWKR